MADAAENFDDMTEEQLAEERGDNYNPEAEDAQPEAEAPEAETEDNAPAAEGDAAEGEQEAEAEADPAPQRPMMLPKSRYDSMKGRMDRENERLREELEQMRQGAQQQTEQQQAERPTLDSQLAEMDAGIAKAMADGDHEQAAQLMNSARRMERQAFQEALQHTSQNTSTQAQQSMEYDMFIDQLEASRPELNAESEQFDEALSNEVVDLMQAFAARGDATPKQALERALAYTYPEGWREQPAPAAAAARSTDVGKNIETAQSQPPRMDAGVTSDKAGMGEEIDIMALSDEEFDKLTDEQLARMRGDDG
ncbi:MAG: hypothetical protein GY764_05310 [Halieaceae bacterium]|nr:hypothetical protein [Halieaceae bacterium]